MAIPQTSEAPSSRRTPPERIESDDEAWEYIQQLDLSLPRRKLLDPRWGKPLPEAVVDHGIRDYRRFLFLIRTHDGEALSPTLDIDLVWHEHIMDTKPYFADTAALFGYYLHHEPGREPTGGRTPELEQGFRRTCELYRQRFGEELDTYFGRLPSTGEGGAPA